MTEETTENSYGKVVLNWPIDQFSLQFSMSDCRCLLLFGCPMRETLLQGTKDFCLKSWLEEKYIISVKTKCTLHQFQTCLTHLWLVSIWRQIVLRFVNFPYCSFSLCLLCHNFLQFNFLAINHIYTFQKWYGCRVVAWDSNNLEFLPQSLVYKSIIVYLLY